MYVACEGESTEPDYLRYLNEQFGDGDDGRRPFRIQPVYRKNGMTPAKVVEAVREAAAEDEAWALFDRDSHHEIPQAVKAAAASGIEFAFSHPSFDLWLLLHFQMLTGAQSGSSKIVVEKLRQATDAFKDYDKRGDKSVKGARRDALKGREGSAVAHARGLVASCAAGRCTPAHAKTEPVGRDAGPWSTQEWAARSGHALDCPISQRDPSTDVWRLLVALGIHLGGN
ncbi:RloB family protein [Sphaerimonospora mesophila]|uniref:RloB family protein n=1 Tax=Sphaerimonospora mesophila TaxID=37483 RepID=UPI0006E26D8A